MIITNVQILKRGSNSRPKMLGIKWIRVYRNCFMAIIRTLNHKEFAICRIIADTLWDLEGDALYIEVNARAEAQLSELFENIQEIEGVIKDLVEKGIVKNQTRYFWFGGNSRWVLKSVKVLNLRKDIEAAVFEIISTEFENALKEALAP